MKFRLLILLLISVELVIIGFLGFRIREKQKKVLGVANVNPIKKESIVFNPDSKLKYFYEPKAGEKIIHNPPWLPYEVTYTINADSLNERFEYGIDKSPGTFRIVTIGDSHTFGHYVNTEDNYPEQLEDALNKKMNCQNIKKFEVINLGMMGYDIQYSVHRLKIRGLKYKPDLILWFLKEDDFTEILELERPLIIEEQNKLLVEDKKDPIKMYKPWRIAQKIILNKYGEENILKQQDGFLNDFSQNYTGDLLIFTYADTPNKYKERIQIFVKNRTNTYFWEGFAWKEIDRLPDSHPSSKGYTFLVDKLFTELMDEKIIPCD